MAVGTKISRRRMLGHALGAAAAGIALPHLALFGVAAAGPPTSRSAWASSAAGGATGNWPSAKGARESRPPRADRRRGRSQPEAGGAVGRQLPAARPTRTTAQLLDRKDVDVVVYATPEHWHYLPCIHACQAGKDIYGEQPLSHTIREGRVMVQAVRKYQRVFQTGEHAAIPPRDAQGRGTDPQRADRQAAIDHRLQLSQPLRVRFPRPADSRVARLGPLVRAERGRALPHRSVSVAHPLRARAALLHVPRGEIRRGPGLDVVPALLGRRAAQLGLPRTEHGPLGPGHGPQRPGRDLGRPRREDGKGGLPHAGEARSRGCGLLARRSSTTSMPTAWC